MSTKRLKEKFGVNPDAPEFADLPTKVSGTTVSRILNCKHWSMCPECFPHGREVPNSKWFKDLSCWKRYRKTQYRPK